MKFTDADIESNNKFKMMSGLASPGEGGGGGFGGGGGGFGEEPGVGGGGEFGGAPGGEFGGGTRRSTRRNGG